VAFSAVNLSVIKHYVFDKQMRDGASWSAISCCR